METAKRPTLEDAICLAAQAHAGQLDKGGEPYLFHPLRMMLNLDGAHERMTAVLHDVVEHSAVTLDDLEQQGYPPEVVAAVETLTRRPGESYEAFIERIKPHPLAVRVKLADLRDNLFLARRPEPGQRDADRIRRYEQALAELEKVSLGLFPPE